MDKLNVKGHRLENEIPLGRAGDPCEHLSICRGKKDLTLSSRYRSRGCLPVIARGGVDNWQYHGGDDRLVDGQSADGSKVVDGGESHLRSCYVPYPEAVLKPETIKDLIKGKL
jgi:hypothetical protein